MIFVKKFSFGFTGTSHDALQPHEIHDIVDNKKINRWRCELINQQEIKFSFTTIIVQAPEEQRKCEVDLADVGCEVALNLTKEQQKKFQINIWRSLEKSRNHALILLSVSTFHRREVREA